MDVVVTCQPLATGLDLARLRRCPFARNTGKNHSEDGGATQVMYVHLARRNYFYVFETALRAL